jgi:exonuclease VII small subunit
MRNKNLFEKKLSHLSSILIELKRMTGDSRETVISFNTRIESAEDIIEDLQSMVEQDNTIS